MKVADNQRKENRVLQDANLEQHYRLMFDLFQHDGWKRLMEDVGKLERAVSNVDSVDAQHSVDFRKGQRDIIKWLLSQREIHEIAYDQLLEENPEPELPEELL